MQISTAKSEFKKQLEEKDTEMKAAVEKMEQMKGDFNIKMTKLKVLELEMIRKLDGDDDTNPSKENDIGLNINDFSEL